jgi:hypothetical protein
VFNFNDCFTNFFSKIVELAIRAQVNRKPITAPTLLKLIISRHVALGAHAPTRI